MYNQKNLRWRWKRLGSAIGTTIGGSGCLLTCIAQLLTNYGVSVTPPELNQQLLKAKLFVDECLIPDYAPARLYPNKIEFIGRVYGKKEMLKRNPGEEVILKVDNSDRPGVQRHFVILKWVNADGQIIVADPLGGVVGPLKRPLICGIKYKFKEV